MYFKVLKNKSSILINNDRENAKCFHYEFFLNHTLLNIYMRKF